MIMNDKSETELAKMAELWVNHTATHIDSERVEFDQNEYEISIMCETNPWGVVKIISNIIELLEMRKVSGNISLNENIDIILANLSAGLLEDLLRYHGSEVIAHFENRAMIDPRYVSVLKDVWKNRISDDVWNRIQRIIAPT